jgi:RNA polymerase sigma-70 factor, ECF subfamily
VSPADSIDFAQRLTEHQGQIYGYLYSLSHDHHAACDILQETNVVLWNKAAEFNREATFLPWAFAIARFQFLAYLRDHKRREQKLLDPDVATLLHQTLEDQAADVDVRSSALQKCMGSLTATSRELLAKRYNEGFSIRDIADSSGRDVSAVKVNLHRIRKTLRDCIQIQLRENKA